MTQSSEPHSRFTSAELWTQLPLPDVSCVICVMNVGTYAESPAFDQRAANELTILI